MTNAPASIYMIEAECHAIPGDGAASLRMVAPGPPSGPDESVEAAAARANRLHAACQATLQKGFAYAAELGRVLCDIRARLPHGEWEAFAREHLTFSLRTAQVYMKMAAFADEQARRAAPDAEGELDEKNWSSIREATRALNSLKAESTEASSARPGRRGRRAIGRWKQSSLRLREIARELDEAELQALTPAERCRLRHETGALMSELFLLFRRCGRVTA